MQGGVEATQTDPVLGPNLTRNLTRRPEGAGNPICGYHAAALYSWMRPLSRSRRRTWSRSTSVSDPGRWFFDRRLLVQRAVGAMLVVMTDVDREDAFEVPSIDDQDPVETLAAYGADPPFDEGVRAGRAHGCADRPDGLGSEHLVEPSCELAVAVVDQKADRLRALDKRLDDVARLLGRPLTRRVRGDSRQIHLPGRELPRSYFAMSPGKAPLAYPSAL